MKNERAIHPERYSSLERPKQIYKIFIKYIYNAQIRYCFLFCKGNYLVCFLYNILFLFNNIKFFLKSSKNLCSLKTCCKVIFMIIEIYYNGRYISNNLL